jgi:hypothetical protein
VAVDDSGPARLDGIDSHGQADLIVTNTGVSACFVGGSDVTADTGMTVGADSTCQVTLRFGDALFAVCGSTESTTIEVLESKW